MEFICFGYTVCNYKGVGVPRPQITARGGRTMLFCKKKKKNHTALKVIAIIVAAVAAVAAGYVIFEKFIKGKLCCCKKNDDSVEAFDLSDECCECCDCEIADEVVEEIAAEDAE